MRGGRLHLRLGFVVLGPAALERLAVTKSLHIASEAVPLWQHAELRSPHDVRADVHVGGGEAGAADLIPEAEQLIEDRHDLVVAAIAKHAGAVLRRLPADGVVG